MLVMFTALEVASSDPGMPAELVYKATETVPVGVPTLRRSRRTELIVAVARAVNRWPKVLRVPLLID